MEYERLIYTNERGDSLELSVNSIYHCNVSKDVTGLSDVRNTIYSSSSVGQHGDTYDGQRIEPREITAIGHINTSDKAQARELRRKALRIFNPELGGTIKYICGDYEKIISCRIDSSPQFSKKSVLTQFDVTFNCLDPFFRDELETKEDIASWVSSWEFPTCIDNNEGMIFGYREESVIVDCYNEGDVATYMRIKFTALGTVVNPVLLNVDTQEYIQINATMEAGDVIVIDTTFGNKSVILIRNGEKIDYFRKIDADSTFMKLEIGDNIFRYDAGEGINALEVSIYYNAKYLGV